MISVIITAFKEPKTIGKAIEAILNQTFEERYEIIVSAPDDETLNVVKRYAKAKNKVKTFKDPGKGKSYALNLLFKRVKSDILILTDGDVYTSSNAVKEIAKLFENEKIGCVTGRPVPQENRGKKYGYWANFLFDAAHRIRKRAFVNNSFIECSGYLFAFRKKIINKIPLDVAEDTFIPYVFWERGYKIGYAERAEVYVKNVDNWVDWVKQKVRTAKAHETLEKYVDIRTTKRVKTFGTELKGIGMLFSYPRSLQEFWWTIELAFARAYMWGKVFWDTRLKNKHYGDAWERVESTK